MLSERKKRRVKMGAVLGAVSGTAVAAVLYFVASPALFYFILAPVAALVGAAQMYMTQDE